MVRQWVLWLVGRCAAQGWLREVIKIERARMFKTGSDDAEGGPECADLNF